MSSRDINETGGLGRVDRKGLSNVTSVMRLKSDGRERGRAGRGQNYSVEIEESDQKNMRRDCSDDRMSDRESQKSPLQLSESVYDFSMIILYIIAITKG